MGATVWSTGGLCIKLLPYDAFTILFYRSVFAALTFLAVFRRRALTLTPMVVLVGLEYTALATCFVVATKMTTAANAVLLQYTAPIYVFLLEPILFKFKLTRLNVITVVVCTLGMLLFCRRPGRRQPQGQPHCPLFRPYAGRHDAHPTLQ
ncbi:MAG: DMT family transporter [Haliscomenobacter sp.]|nr:DMT family transporter [Haliscomenobacter sp.]